MIKKTFLCAAGLAAGVSTGAYVDGFFEQENVVTNTYQQIVSNFDSPVAANADSADPANGPQSMLAQDSSAVDPNAKPAAAMMSQEAEEALAADAKAGSAQDAVADSKNATKSTDVAAKMKDAPSQAAAESKKEKAKPKNDQQQDEKSIALLDLRFSKETFKSPQGGELKYRKLTPRTDGNAGPLPLIVFLHGKGERGDDNVTQLKHGLDYLASREGMLKFPATIIAPQCPIDTRWSTMLADDAREAELEAKPTEAMRLTMELIDSIQITDNVSPDRIYVTGLSMGGFGTFDLVARRPATFAAAVPLCGGCDTNPEVVQQLKKVPMWVIHGDGDKVVDVEKSRSIVKALKEAGGQPRYSELAGFGHNIWDAAYADTELYKWMFSQSRAGVIKSSMAANTSKTKSADANKSDDNAAQPSQSSSTSLEEAIQSDWQVLAATRRGRRADAATLEKMKVKFEERSVTISIGDRSEAAKYELPEAKDSPYPWIDMISERQGVKVSTGILAMQGDKLVICWAMPGEERPTTFDSREGVKTLVLQKK
jgi:uncharacterized protein (TIGR03067 family)